MGKKNKKNKQEFVDPYTLAYMKSQGDIESMSCDVSDNVELDDDGVPFVVDDRDDYVYDDAPQGPAVVTPSYMDFLMSGAKSGKKKHKKSKEEYQEDYDLSQSEQKNASVEDIMNSREVKVSKVDVPSDLEEMFPGVFDTAGDESMVDIDRDENDGWFGPEAYDEEESDEEVEEAMEEEPEYQVPHMEHSVVEPVSEPDIEASAVESTEVAKPSWTELSKFCAMHFEPIEELGRLIIDDRIAPSCVIDSVINMQYFSIDLDRVREMLYSTETDGQATLDLTYMSKAQDAIWMYILSSKHPAAIFTLRNFMEAFEDIDHIDTKNFRFVYDSRNRDTIGDMIYAYHIPATEQRRFNNYVKAVSKGFTSDENFFNDVPGVEREAIAKFLVIVWIAEHLQEQREVFPAHDVDYVTAFRTTGIHPGDTKSFPKFNKLVDFVELVRNHRATEFGAPKTYKDLDNIFAVYDFDLLRDTCFDIFDRMKEEDDDDDFDDMGADEFDMSDPLITKVDPEESPVETPEIVDADDEVDIDFDPMVGLADQINEYADDDTDYSALIDPAAKEDTATGLADALYQDYKSEVVKNGGKVLSKEELADQVRGGIIGEMHIPSTVAATPITKTETYVPLIDKETDTWIYDSYEEYVAACKKVNVPAGLSKNGFESERAHFKKTHPEVTPKEEPKETPKNDVGSSTMMEALAKAGCIGAKAPEKPPVTSLGSVPVFRK